jgi:hypothetical protein
MCIAHRVFSWKAKFFPLYCITNSCLLAVIGISNKCLFTPLGALFPQATIGPVDQILAAFHKITGFEIHSAE